MSSKNSKSTPFAKKKASSGSPFKMIAIFALLVLIIAGFIVAPALASLVDSGSRDFGRFGNVPIRYTQGSYFYNQVSFYNNMYRDMMSENPDFFEIYRNNIWRTAFSDTVGYAAKKYLMQQSGFDVSSQAIDKMVVKSGYYSDEDGNFDAELYSSTTNADKERVRKSLVSSLYASQYASDVLGGLYKNEEQIDFISNISPKERQISYIAISSSDYPDDLLKKQGEANAEVFRSRELSRIVVETEKEAKEVLKALEENQDFAEVAQTQSKDYTAQDGGALNSRYYYEISDEIDSDAADKVFSLSTGSVSEPIETEYGWYIYQADGEIQEADFTDENILYTVRSWLSWNYGEILDQWVADQAAKVEAEINNSSFSTAASTIGKTPQTSGYFNLNWGGSPLLGSSVSSTTQDSVLQGALKSDAFYQEVFSLDIDEVSEPISLGDKVLIAKLIDERDSESAIAGYYINNFIMQNREELWAELSNESELLNNNFEEAYSILFPAN